MSQPKPQVSPEGPRTPGSSPRRLLAILAVLILLCVSTLILLTLDAYFRHTPVHPINSPFEWLILCVIAADFAVMLIRRSGWRSPRGRRFSLIVQRANHSTRSFLFERRQKVERAIPWALALFAVIWVPEYLVQPLWTDHEHMLIMAQLWNAGEFPWKAMHTYQFPGGMETAWLSARLFGWGEPRGFYATNLAVISLAGFAMTAWARRNLGRRAYGLLGFMALAFVEAAQPFTGVAQRDSQTTWLAMTALLAPAAFPGRFFGSILSAVCLALAVAIRPHALIYFPVVLCGIFWNDMRAGNFDLTVIRSRLFAASRTMTFRIWLIVFLAAAAIFLSPVLGIRRTPAFLEALKFPLTQPGDYSRGAFSAWDDVLDDSLTRQRNVMFLLFSGFMMLPASGQPIWRRLAIGQVAIFACVVIYRAAHPVDHGYMKLPMQFWTCLGAMTFPAWLATKFWKIPTFTWISMLGGILIASLPPTSLFVSAGDWPAAMRDLTGNRTLEVSPNGAKFAYPRPPIEYHYTWDNWQAARIWLARNTGESTRILNLLSFQPFPAFLGTLGRLPIGRLESFVMLTWFKRYDFDTEIVNSLANAPSGSLVIWDNERTNPVHRVQVGESSRYILERFVPAARFGEIEIWRKP